MVLPLLLRHLYARSGGTVVLTSPTKLTPKPAPAALWFLTTSSETPLCTLWRHCGSYRSQPRCSICGLVRLLLESPFTASLHVCCFMTRLSRQSLPRYTSCRYSNSSHLATVCPSLPLRSGSHAYSVNITSYILYQ